MYDFLKLYHAAIALFHSEKSICVGVCDTACLQVISENILLDYNSFIWLFIAPEL